MVEAGRLLARPSACASSPSSTALQRAGAGADVFRHVIAAVDSNPRGRTRGRPGQVASLGRPVRRRFALPVLLVVVLVLVASLLVLHDQVRYYRISSGSMQPTLPIGSRVAVEAGLAVRVGEIVALYAPAGATPDTPVCGAPGQGAGFQQPCGLATADSSNVIFIKRIVAGPGDLVSILAGRAVVNGATSTEPFAVPCASDPNCNFPTPVGVPPGQYYVLGDDRGASDDSRFWGPVPANWMVGVAVHCQPLQTACQPLH